MGIKAVMNRAKKSTKPEDKNPKKDDKKTTAMFWMKNKKG